MVLCFPVESDNGLDSMVYGHFGSAPMFIIYNTTTNEFSGIDNQNLHHEHGMCNPIQAIDGNKVDAILVGGIGAGAINKLNDMGIRVFRAIEGSVKNNVKLFVNNSLPEISLQHACNQHGGCGH